jgi:hypothetical protein
MYVFNCSRVSPIILITLQPCKHRIRDKAPDFKTEDAILYCFVGYTTRLRKRGR